MHRAIAWDANTRPEHQDLSQALKPFGLHVYQDPTFARTSYTSFLISDRELTPEELEVVSKDFWDT